MTSPKPLPPDEACILPEKDAPRSERLAYLACRAKSLAYHIQELSLALDRDYLSSEARVARNALAHIKYIAENVAYYALTNNPDN